MKLGMVTGCILFVGVIGDIRQSRRIVVQSSSFYPDDQPRLSLAELSLRNMEQSTEYVEPLLLIRDEGQIYSRDFEPLASTGHWIETQFRLLAQLRTFKGRVGILIRDTTQIATSVAIFLFS